MFALGIDKLLFSVCMKSWVALGYPLSGKARMTIGNFIFWTCFFGVIAALLAFTNITSLFQPVPLVLATLAVSIFHEHS